MPTPDAPGPNATPRAPDPTALAIEIADTQSHLTVDHNALARLARAVLLAEEVAAASVSIALVDDPTIHALNRRHLQHDWPTDVISFLLSDPDERPLVGELVISTQMACTMAHDLGARPADELALYLVHGLLHLCGHDDQDDASAAVMRRREREHLTAAGIAHAFERPGVGPGPQGDRS